jgi:hypothetical protein
VCGSGELTCRVLSSGFVTEDNSNKMTVDAMNIAPNIEMGILKTGRSWRTSFDGRANA